jgi:preprotein translocase subunit YajC
MTEFILAMIALLLVITLLFVGAMYYMLQRGLKEVIKGMNSFDERLSQIEKGNHP